MFNGSREVKERLETVESTCRKLREEVDALNRRTSLDWEELQDKVHRWMQRTGARARSEQKAAGVVQNAASGVVQFNGLQPTMPGVDPVSARILSRRRRGAVVQAVPPLPVPEGQLFEDGDEQSS